MREVSIKGIRQGILLVLPEEPAWEAVCEQLESKLVAAASLLAGAKAHIDLGDRPLAESQLRSLLGHLKDTYDLEAQTLVGGPITQALAYACGLETPSVVVEERQATVPATLHRPGMNNALYLRQTLRSGQVIHHEGHLVIAGDVNPGAEIVATGDIMVFGVLRGVAHAGSAGDENAQIIANQLRPTQIRIAGFIARSPDHPTGVASKYPEAARVTHGEIHIVPLKNLN
jgi:septum site-determining protein MinC